MDAVILVIVTITGYMVAYHTYGRFLARKIFKLDTRRATPAHTHEDGIDYVPTRKQIIFGHHYTSIAGTGPIVGPAIGIIWGWVPAMIWVFFGAILMGAVHDFGSLVLSLRNEGKSISEAASKYISRRVRTIFFVVVFLELWVVIAIFGIVIAVIFALYPESVFPVWIQIPIAMALGWYLYRRSGRVLSGTVTAVVLLYAMVFLGSRLPLHMPSLYGIPATGLWTILLLIYAYIASTIPVTVLLQPRDYINAWQLYISMGLMLLGIFVSGVSGQLHIVAPAVDLHPMGAPPLMPFLFITIACGAISGFHTLVSSGTTSKQVDREPDALFIGYGSMLLESLLATLVIVCVAGGIGMYLKGGDGTILHGREAWNHLYASWTHLSGLKPKLAAFIIGSANMMQCVGVPKTFGIVIMGLFVASFAGTTLDSATRIQRYIITELADGWRLKPLGNRYVATSVAVVTAAVLAFATGADGKGALTLWPMFGAVNQLLAALALGIITLYLHQKGGLKWLVSGIPYLFMVLMTLWAMLVNQWHFIQGSKWLLAGVNGFTLLLALIIVMETIAAFRRGGRIAA